MLIYTIIKCNNFEIDSFLIINTNKYMVFFLFKAFNNQHPWLNLVNVKQLDNFYYFYNSQYDYKTII